MRKTPIFRLISLLLLLSMLPLSALADSCVQCGQETGNNDYVCTACLVALLEGEPTATPLTMTRVRRDYEGTVTIQWADAAGNAPYRVMYALLEGAPEPFGWTDCEATYDTQHTLTRLVPGQSYLLTIEDSQGNTLEYPYYAEPAPQKNEIGMRIFIEPYRRNSYAKNVPCDLTLAQLARPGYTHALYVSLKYSMLAYGRLYDFQLALHAPNGFTDVIFSGSLEMKPGRSTLPDWGRVPLDDYFSYLNRYYGGIPLGKYTATLYFNGDEVCSDSFTIAK